MNFQVKSTYNKALVKWSILTISSKISGSLIITGGLVAIIIYFTQTEPLNECQICGLCT